MFYSAPKSRHRYFFLREKMADLLKGKEGFSFRGKWMKWYALQHSKRIELFPMITFFTWPPLSPVHNEAWEKSPRRLLVRPRESDVNLCWNKKGRVKIAHCTEGTFFQRFSRDPLTCCKDLESNLLSHNPRLLSDTHVLLLIFNSLFPFLWWANTEYSPVALN